ncbi:hypothetical protein H2200_000671 [Cladophialophora chaetospira]|uniref:FAD dependent oxidoreductase domain-containing protein n=1 Tax=Cladophialophora chaetospira TaxID=386627 RepID=A0AA38XP83_9EURO|nr:hypothetical protein H2200_000671 [Cladophialophora chaetospira]
MGDASTPLPSTPSLKQVRADLPSAKPTLSFWQTSYPNDLTHYRSSVSLPTHADIVVIGTGISGTIAVDELFRKAGTTDSDSSKLNVLVLEARTLCSAATGRNGGHLHPIVHAAPPDVLRFEMDNFNYVSNLINSNNIDCDYRRLNGCLGFWNATYFEEAKRALAETPAALSSMVKVVEEPIELKRLGLKDGAVGAIVQSVAASLSPYKLCVTIWEKLLKQSETSEAGARLNLQTTTVATHLSRHGGETWTVHTARGMVQTKAIILATNGYTSHLLPSFSALIRPVQAQMSALIPPPPASHGQERKLIPRSCGFEGVGDMDRVMSDYLVQNPYNPTVENGGGHLMFGGGRHIALNHGENNSDDSYVDKNVERYLRTLPERLDLNFEGKDADQSEHKMLDIAASWTGIIGHSLDGYPWVGQVPDHEGVYLCAGYTGHGMTNAPLCGRYVARMALAELGSAARDIHLADDKSEGLDTSQVWNGKVPAQYLITADRMSSHLQDNA